MTVLGHELPSCGGSATSALRLKANILSRGIEVGYVPQAAIRARCSTWLGRCNPHPTCGSIGSVAFLEAECTAHANDRCIFGLDPAFGVDDVLEVGLQRPTGHDFCRVGNFDQSFVVTGHQQTRIDVKC